MLTCGRAREKSDRFHLWDYESDTANHVLSLSPEQVTSITVLDETFEPGEFVKWKTTWLVQRNWGLLVSLWAARRLVHCV
jgi:hypothetical protein